MRICLHRVLGVISLVLVTVQMSYAQIDETQLRQEIILSYSPLKTLDISGSYRLDLKENMTQFRRSNFEVRADYSILKWLKLITTYRYVTSYERDQHRLALGFAARKNSLNKKYQFQFKSMVHFISDYMDRDYWMIEDPRWVLRMRARFRYDLTKKISLAVYAETFARNFSEEYLFYRMRYGGELSYSPKKRHTLSLGYFYQHEFNRKRPAETQTFSLSYEYEFKKKKKKTTAPITVPSDKN